MRFSLPGAGRSDATDTTGESGTGGSCCGFIAE